MLQSCLNLPGPTLCKKLPVQCCPTFHKNFFLSRSIWANITQGNYLCNVGPWQIKVNNLYNAVSTILGQHCIRILSSQFCPSTSETTLHKKATCTVLAQSRQTCFCTNPSCSFECLVVCFLTGTTLPKNVDSFCSMLAWELIYGLRDNNEQGQHWLEHHQKHLSEKKPFSSNIEQFTVFFCEW